MTALTPVSDELATYPDAGGAGCARAGGVVLNDTWRLDSVLGGGRLRGCHSATHRKGTRAAIKMLPRGYECNEQLRGRLEREALVLS